MLRKFKRSIKLERNKTNNLLFSPPCYNTLPGSLAVCNYAFLDEKDRPKYYFIIARMNELLKNADKLVPFDDPDYIDKTLNYFGMKRAKNLSIALVIGKFNTLFTFFDGEKILPLREDGIMTRTLLDNDSKIIPITFE